MTHGFDLQELLDNLARRLGVPLELEDRRLRLLAYSAHQGPADEVRTESILRRQALPAVVEWVDSLRLDRQEGVVDVPANPALHMGARLCAPVRHEGILLGYLWVIGTLPPAERAVLADGAAAAAGFIWRERTVDEQRLRDEAVLLERLLRGRDFQAGEALADRSGTSVHAPAVVLVIRRTERSRLAEIGERARERAGFPLALLLEPGQLVILGRTADARDIAVTEDALLEAGAGLVGVGDPRPSLAQAADSLREAELAAEVAARIPAASPLAHWRSVSSWGLLLALGDGSAPPLPAPVRCLIADLDLAEAVESVLDHGGNVARAARALSMHRATLYRRLRRAEQLTGTSLTNGGDRFLLQLGIRLWRLGVATDVASERRDL